MAMNWAADMPYRLSANPGMKPPRDTLRICRTCGKMSFLDLPCRKCDAADSMRLYRDVAKKRRRANRLIMVGRSLAYLIAVCVPLLLFHNLLLFLPPFLLLIAHFYLTAQNEKVKNNELYWMLHSQSDPGKLPRNLPMAEDDILIQIREGYQEDIKRLRNMVPADKDPVKAMEILSQAQRLSYVYMSHDLAKLMLDCMELFGQEDGLLLDANRIAYAIQGTESKAELRKTIRQLCFLHRQCSHSVFSLVPMRVVQLCGVYLFYDSPQRVLLSDLLSQLRNFRWVNILTPEELGCFRLSDFAFRPLTEGRPNPTTTAVSKEYAVYAFSYSATHPSTLSNVSIYENLLHLLDSPEERELCRNIARASIDLWGPKHQHAELYLREFDRLFGMLDKMNF